MSDINLQAINAALLCNWKDAESLNLQILKSHPKNTDALNRLAYALYQQGKLEDSKKTYKKVLKIDKYNQIAAKNLQKVSLLKKLPIKKDAHLSPRIHPSLFLEEPGKTKTASLINTAPFSLLSTLAIGEEVFFFPKRFSIEVRDGEKRYIGALPDDLSFRLLRLLKEGNTYRIMIKSIGMNALAVFIREIERNGKFKNQPSFITPLGDYQTSIHRELVDKDREPDKKEEETENEE